jgi:hypothetical protein
MGFEHKKPSVIYCDNQAAIKLSEHDTMHEKSKHFDIALHWIREVISNGEVTVMYIPTQEQQADILTKALGQIQFGLLRDQIMNGTK